jgi:hypothetical protein
MNRGQWVVSVRLFKRESTKLGKEKRLLQSRRENPGWSEDAPKIGAGGGI